MQFIDKGRRGVDSEEDDGTLLALNFFKVTAMHSKFTQMEVAAIIASAAESENGLRT